MRGIFDSELLNLMQATLEHALAALPPEQQTFETRERIAQAILVSSQHNGKATRISPAP